MSGAAHYLLPGKVLSANLCAPGSGAVLVAQGTVLTPEIIGRIRRAGLEEEAQKKLLNRRQASEVGVDVQQTDLASLRLRDRARMAMQRMLESNASLRTVLYLLLVASGLFAAVTEAPEFLWATVAAFSGIALTHVAPAVISASFKRQIEAIRKKEEADIAAKVAFAQRIAEGDEEAIAKIICDTVVVKDNLILLDVKGQTITLHSLMPDTMALVNQAGITLQPAPPGRNRERSQSLRSAEGAEIGILLDALAELVSDLLSVSPSTTHVAVSVFDPFATPEPQTFYLGCIGSLVLERSDHDALTSDADLSLLIRTLPGLKLAYEENGRFREQVPAIGQTSPVSPVNSDAPGETVSS